MTHRRLVWDKHRHDFVPAADFYARKYADMAVSSLGAPLIIRDIDSYRSTITGEMISGRREHRDHLKAHGCIEVGNEYIPPKPHALLPPIAQDVQRAMNDEGLRAQAMSASKRAKEALPE